MMAHIAAYRNPAAVAGVAYALVLAVIGVFATFLAPHDPLEITLFERLAPPAWHGDGDWNHILGSDHIGRDVLSRIAWSFRTNLYVGLLGTFLGIAMGLMLVAATGIGRAAPGSAWTPPPLGLPLYGLAILTYVSGTIVSLMVMVIAGPSTPATVICAGVFSSLLPIGLILRSVQRPLQRSGGLALPLVGLTMPQGIALLAMLFALAFLMGLIIESSLSFLGVGLPPPTPSLGAMVADGRTNVVTAPWISGFPLVFGLVSVVAFWAIVIPVGRNLGRQSDQANPTETRPS